MPNQELQAMIKEAVNKVIESTIPQAISNVLPMVIEPLQAKFDALALQMTSQTQEYKQQILENMQQITTLKQSTIQLKEKVEETNQRFQMMEAKQDLLEDYLIRTKFPLVSSNLKTNLSLTISKKNGCPS
ncbi:UNVERIFIED_CONTAM: hypothetical protein K2H54_010643 [Gekko kuhli]